MSSESESEDQQFDQGDAGVTFSKHFILQRIIGKGAFGTVVAATLKSNLKDYAVKIIQKTYLDQAQYDSFMKEADILGQLNHTNIVKFVKIIESETRVFLIMELVKGGQLQEYIEERKDQGIPFTDEEVATIMRSIFSALQNIHSKDVIHRDLKPQNILLADKKNLESIKICDFGLSAQYEPMQQRANFTTRCGTKTFMAPELFQKKTYGKPVDIWSCGIIMYMLFSGGKHPLYESSDNEESYWAKLKDPEWIFPPSFNRYSKDLFFKLVCSDPIGRYTAEHALNHPWITRRFQDDIPLTSPEKMRAFSHSQILSRIIKTMYIIYKLPGSKLEVDSEHKQRILESNPRNDSGLHRKTSALGESFKALFESYNNDTIELTTAASYPNHESRSPSPFSMVGNASPTQSPKYPVQTINSQPLLTIPENDRQETQKETDVTIYTPEKINLGKSFYKDPFSLPESQYQVNDIYTKKLQFTLSVVPVKYEGRNECEQITKSKASPLKKEKNIYTFIEESAGSINSLKINNKSMKKNENDFIKNLKTHAHNNSTGSPVIKMNLHTQNPSPNQRINTSTSTSNKSPLRTPLFKNTIDAELLDQFRLKEKKDDQANEIRKEPKERRMETPRKERESPTPSYVEIKTPRVNSNSPLKTRASAVRKISVNSRPIVVEDNKVKDMKTFKLPSIHQDIKERVSLIPSRKSPIIEPTSKTHAPRLSISPLKSSKEWAPSKVIKPKMITNDKNSGQDQFQ